MQISVEQERDNWMETARIYALNSKYYEAERDKLIAERDAIKTKLSKYESVNGFPHKCDECLANGADIYHLNNRLKAENERLKAELARSAAENVLFREAINRAGGWQLLEERDQLKARLKETHAEIARQEQSINQHCGEKSVLRQACEAAQKEAGRLKAENERLREALRVIEHHLSTLNPYEGTVDAEIIDVLWGMIQAAREEK